MSCRYTQERIHCLPFRTPKGSRAWPIILLDAIVRGLYRSFDNSGSIAYKGGHHEKDLLGKLGIPAINLESFSCPKVEYLFGNLLWLETCGHHTERNAYQHCAKVEVEAFGDWLKTDDHW